jgi:hypothetical protein
VPPIGLVARASVRGLVAAMAMTGLRVVTTRSGLPERTPPDTIVDQAAPAAVSQLPKRQREVVTQLAHWLYGASGGAAYALLAERIRRRAWSGPAYGGGLWLLFELAISPALQLEYARERPIAWRAMIILDHLLYGVIVGGRLAPEEALLNIRQARSPRIVRSGPAARSAKRFGFDWANDSTVNRPKGTT